jgi:Protein of unknown function (DUF3106)
MAAAAAVVFLFSADMSAQGNRARQQSAPRSQAPHQNRPEQSRTPQPRAQQPRTQERQSQPLQNRQILPHQQEFENRIAPARPAYNGLFPQTAPRPGVNSFRPSVAMPPQSSQPVTPNRETVRPALPTQQRPSTTYPGAAPPGHLGSWLNQHGNLPVQGQEQILRSDPNFKRLPQSDQQRLMQQLQQVNQLPEQERQRRLARAETIERMNPQERMQLNQSTRQLSNLPSDRQTVVKRAFRDLRGVPLDQRQTVLNSQRYQGQFTPEERGILSNLLRAEPYQPQ